MANASGIFKALTYKKEVTFGTVPAASAAQALRRISSDLSLTKETYQSSEIRPDQQIADFRHGVRRVTGKISGDISAKTFSDFIGSACRKVFASLTAATAVSVTIAGTAPNYTVTRAAGSYLTDGFKIGHVIRLSVGTLNAANINKNLLITGLTATVANVITLNASALVAEGPITGTTITMIGKQTFMPVSGHVQESYSIEHWFSDVPASEVFSGCKINGFTANLSPTGIATIDFDVMGQNITTSASQYFTSPTAATTTGSMAAVNGVVRMNGATVGILTGLTLNANTGITGDPVVGSNVVPAFYPGTMNVTGQATAFFDATTLRDVFLNETEIEIVAVFTADNTATSDFVTFVMPRVKLGSHSKGDGDKAIPVTMDFQALLNTAGGAGTATEQTTLLIQDSAA
jgi:hypothetical protein